MSGERSYPRPVFSPTEIIPEPSSFCGHAVRPESYLFPIFGTRNQAWNSYLTIGDFGFLEILFLRFSIKDGCFGFDIFSRTYLSRSSLLFKNGILNLRAF